MEPMQEIMSLHKQSNMRPKDCLTRHLYERYRYTSGEDTRVATSKRRKRKPAAAPAANNKKSKATANNHKSNNNNNNMNNIMMSPSNGTNFSLASQDVMVVGEPSMMGGDFGDGNERMITRLENTQCESTISSHSNNEETDGMISRNNNNNNLNNSPGHDHQQLSHDNSIVSTNSILTNMTNPTVSESGAR